MKAKRISALILIAAMVLGITACGGSKKETAEEPAQETAVEEEKEEVTEEETKEEEAAEEPAGETEEEPKEVVQKELKNGFNEETNTTITVGNFEFQIPDYAVLSDDDDETDNMAHYIIEADSNNQATASFSIVTQKVDVEFEREDFENNIDKLIDGFMEGASFTEVQRDGDTYTGKFNGIDVTGKIRVILNDNDKSFAYLVLIQTLNSEFDYSADYDKIVDSVVYKEAQEGESTDDLDPEFKEMMDSYEAFFDEYIAFMEKYKENPTDMSLLSELSDMLTKEAEMLKEMEGLDQSEMSAAELAYYLEVTGRIYEKLGKVAQF